MTGRAVFRAWVCRRLGHRWAFRYPPPVQDPGDPEWACLRCAVRYLDVCPSCAVVGQVAAAGRAWVCVNCGATGWVDTRRVPNPKETAT